MGYDRPLDMLQRTKGLTATQRTAIERGNAARLLGLQASRSPGAARDEEAR